jgi:hypothetical protein
MYHSIQADYLSTSSLLLMAFLEVACARWLHFWKFATTAFGIRIQTFLICGVVCFFLLACGSIALAHQQPNVILLVADDLGWGETHCNGHPHVKTPTLDRNVTPVECKEKSGFREPAGLGP